jgi:hypothetical protein
MVERGVRVLIVAGLDAGSTTALLAKAPGSPLSTTTA